MLQIRKGTANIWEYKVDNNATIANLYICEKPELPRLRIFKAWKFHGIFF